MPSQYTTKPSRINRAEPQEIFRGRGRAAKSQARTDPESERCDPASCRDKRPSDRARPRSAPDTAAADGENASRRTGKTPAASTASGTERLLRNTSRRDRERLSPDDQAAVPDP